ncbi:MAG TPA: hypothetical protein VHN20_08450 [Beijerinckiaceae bacterium]|nr:hypothetical protein [Beijerinckiaceae bacterium]
MQILALIWGILAMLGMVVAFMPCLGSLNWLNIPFSFVGLIIGIVAAGKPSRSKGAAIAGIVMCAIAMIFGLVRLTVGGGIL